SFAAKTYRSLFHREHGISVDDKGRLFRNFNDWLNEALFLQCEEVNFTDNPTIGDRIKSLITADHFQVERKHGPVFQIPNRLGIWLTTNHAWAVPAGVEDRRFVVFGVNEGQLGPDVDARGQPIEVGSVVQNHSYFGKLQDDLDAGGLNQLL